MARDPQTSPVSPADGGPAPHRPVDPKWWARTEICRVSLMAMAEELAPFGIELLAIKGVYIAYAVAAGSVPIGALALAHI